MIDENEERSVLLRWADKHNMRNGEFIFHVVGVRHRRVRSAIDAVKADRELLKRDELQIVSADAPHELIVSDSQIRMQVPGSGSA